MFRSTQILVLLLAVLIGQGLTLVWRARSWRQRLRGLGSLALGLGLLAMTHLQVGVITTPALPSRPVQMASQPAGDAELRRSVLAMVAPRFTDLGQVGLVVATLVGSRQEITTFGSIAVDSGLPPADDTLFEIGSLTKLFTAGLLAAAIEQGTFSLESRVVESISLPAQTNPDQRLPAVSLRQLVTHTSGLPRMSLDVWRPTEVLSLLAGGTPYALYSTPKVKELLAGNRLLRPPGAGFSYSNLGFGVLGLVLAERAGLPYEQLLTNTITRPLGLHDTGSRLDASAAPRLAPAYRGYFRLGSFYLTQTATPANFGDGLVAAGGVYSSGRDMLRFLAANLNPEAFPGLGFLRWTHPTLYEEGETRIGMGWFKKTLPGSRQEILYHSGLTGGQASFVGIDLENRLGVVLLGNVSRPVDELGYALLEELRAKFAKTEKK